MSAKDAARTERVQELFSRIEEAIGNQEEEEPDSQRIVQLCDKILQETPKDIDAIICKATALLNMQKWGETVKFLKKHQKQIPKFAFILAYALYKSDKLKDALSTLDRMQEKTDAAVHLEAQIHYKMGEFGKSAKTYESNYEVKNLEDDEVCTNICAAYVSGGLCDHAMAQFDVSRSSQSSYELAYNLSHALVENLNFDQASALLNQAKDTCETYLREEEYTDAEIEEESASLRVQAAYILHLQGQIDSASKTYSEILQSEDNFKKNEGHTAINNSLCIQHSSKPEKDASDSYKKVNTLLTNKDYLSKLSKKQKTALQMNRILLAMYSRQHGTVEKLAKSFSSSFPDSNFPVLVLSALNFRDKKFPEAVAILQNWLSEHPTDITCALSLAHIYLSINQTQEATKLLSSLSEIEHTPALVATLVALHEKENDHKSAANVLDRAISYWKDYMGDKSSKTHYSVLVKQSAEYKLQHGLLEEAFEEYKHLVNENPNDISLLGHAIIAGNNSDPKTTEQMGRELPDLPGIDEIDLDELESLPGPGAKNVYQKKHDGKKRSVEELEQIAEKRKEKRRRKRKIRYPKNFDPEKPGPKPDPDRWLPRWKKMAKRKGRKKKQYQVKGGQGGDLEGAEKLQIRDIPTEPEQATKQQQQQRSQNKNKRNNKKRGKKGRRKGRR